MPADALYAGFYMQAPTTEIALYATLLENLWNDEFVEGYQAMAQWSRDQVPVPGAALRQVVDELVRENVLMTGQMQLGGRDDRLHADRAATSSTRSREKDNVVPRAAAEPASRSSATRAPRRAPARAAATSTFVDRQPRVQADAARDRRRGSPSTATSSTRRRSADGDPPARAAATSDAMERFFARIPEGDRTFFKEDVDDRQVIAAWTEPGAGRFGRASTATTVVGYVARRPAAPAGRATSASSASIVDPDHRGRGVGGRSRATPCWRRSTSA